ncbi:DegT/DnrJ/EryC1/StrS family aminotransferase [Sinanaerobacter chloroacetimidivorans]|uniref:DegT/DnrJ/EryC1/StrS family aminotransferase n=1 Tax=Sinanaerobacter chloroacetimidivorans TaxID=2818044 RepID=A0A8J8B4N7_9FIRM|nr:DegT/DnrJ/EryC1/StrS family aminotransferase [Sinanaerobacter chloroacetimidivorans]MBR0599530.1 DegT/DnrJ/EryC1/StrS family aminotransferase [Sinanaerobacter chloroacetimidivorans]
MTLLQFIDLGKQYEALKDEIDAQIHKVLLCNQFIMGPEIDELEGKLKTFIGRNHCITCGSGTDALQIIYMAYGLGKGDAVFCPDVTFIASIEPACLLGATPIFCDIDKKTYNISIESLKEQINRIENEGILKPKMVVAVDFLGNPAAFEELNKVCKEHNLILIEDAAQGMGAQYNGKMCCSFGQASATSFFPAKPLGCYGDGGAIFTDDDEIADICRSIRVHGKGETKYDNIRIGTNGRLDTLQAAVLLPKLKAFQTYEMKRRNIVAKRYDNYLKEKYIIPYIESKAVSIYAQYALCVENRDQRDLILKKLTEAGIPNMIYYPTPMHRLKVFSALGYRDDEFSISNHYCNTTFSIPIHPYLNEKEQDIIINTLLNI